MVETSQPPGRRRRRLSGRRKALFALATLGLVLGGAEAAFQVREVSRRSRRPSRTPRVPDTYRGAVLPPGHRFAVGEMTGEINALGMREREVAPAPAAGTLRVLCVGGSTTYGMYATSNQATWPARLEQALRARGREQVEVLNAGVPGWTLRESQTNLELRLYALRPEVVICYHGYNDLMANLDPRYRVESEREDVAALWRPLRASALYRFLIEQLHDPRRALEHKAAAPDPEGFAAFERNLRRFVRRTREEGARPVLCTFPSAYRATRAASEQAGVPGLVDWYDERSPLEYAALMEGLRRHDEAIRRVAREEGVPLIDLAARVPPDPALYMDPIHHSDAGERVKGEVAAEALLESGVLDGGRR